jgi:hypothetical protein
MLSVNLNIKILLQNRPTKHMHRTLRHVPFRGIFSLEDIVRFVGWSAWQSAGNARRSALD